LLAAAGMYFLNLGATDLWAPDEPRFAAVAEELRSMAHGVPGLVVLHLNGAPYTQKPPLYYWTAGLLGALPGRVTELAARLPSALAGLGCIWLTVQFATALTRNPRVGILSGALLLTVFRFAHFARRAQLDILLSFFVLLALYALFRLRNMKRDRGPWFLTLHVALALAVLTKGPIGLLPIPAFALYLAWQGELRDFPRIFPVWSFAISLGPVLIWLAFAVSLAPPGFFDEAVIENLFGRFFTGTAHIRDFSYFFVHFPLEFLPWSVLWPAVGFWIWRNCIRGSESVERDGSRLLVSWIGLCFVFFSISAGKRGLYLLPVYPAVAILSGLALEDVLSRRTTLPRSVWAVFGAMACGALGFGAWVFFAQGFALSGYPGFELPTRFGAMLALVAGICSLAAVTMAITTRNRGVSPIAQLLAPLAGIYLLELLVFTVAYPAFDDEKSPAPASRVAAELSAVGAPLGVFDHSALVGGVAYYSGREVVEVRDPESLREFLAAGGSHIIIKESKLERIPEWAEFAVRASFRSGSRRLLVIGPAAETAPSYAPEPLSPR
jgi:4-amino-4-deoxy-L-arabinose transferase-like glycosyltransferase